MLLLLWAAIGVVAIAVGALWSSAAEKAQRHEQAIHTLAAAVDDLAADNARLRLRLSELEHRPRY